MELFISALPYEVAYPELAPARLAMRSLCLRAWEKLGLQPRLLPEDYNWPDPKSSQAGEFFTRQWQRSRRILPEAHAHHDFYLSTSDDVMPDVTTFDVAKARAIMEAHPQFAILACWPLNETINRWTPNNYEVFEDDDVMEHYSVGTISFIRKGAMLDWPKMGEGRGYDSIQCEYLRSHGWRVGLLKNMGCVHLGKGFSTVTPCSPS